MTDMDGEAAPRDGVGNSRGQGHSGRKPLHQVGEKGKVAHVFGSQLDPRVAGEKGKKGAISSLTLHCHSHGGNLSAGRFFFQPKFERDILHKQYCYQQQQNKQTNNNNNNNTHT